MHPDWGADSNRPPGAGAAVFVATFAGLLVLIGLLLSFDILLARAERNEAASHAAREYATGVGLMHRGRPRDASEHFATAVSIERSNVRYALGLAEATRADGRLAEAERTLRDLLDRAENDGAVNLAMARTLVQEHRLDEAKAYFHRAVYGRWGADSTARRTEARFELIALLERTQGGPELLAELLPFEDVSPDSIALRRRLGTLFIEAGSPARGADMLRDVLRRNPQDAEAYAGMGDAALALGNFRTARADFAQALRLAPDDTAAAAHLAIVDTILALDPTTRGLPLAERQRRGRELLARTLAAASACGIAGPSPVIDSAMTLLARSASRPTVTAVDDMVDLAVALGSGLRSACRSRPGSAPAGPLSRLLDRLGR